MGTQLKPAFWRARPLKPPNFYFHHFWTFIWYIIWYTNVKEARVGESKFVGMKSPLLRNLNERTRYIYYNPSKRLYTKLHKIWKRNKGFSISSGNRVGRRQNAQYEQTIVFYKLRCFFKIIYERNAVMIRFFQWKNHKLIYQFEYFEDVNQYFGTAAIAPDEATCNLGWSKKVSRISCRFVSTGLEVLSKLCLCI